MGGVLVAAVAALGGDARIRPSGKSCSTGSRADGFMSGYRGVRIAKSGRRFIIEDGVVWELIDAHGTRHGQAATFSSWRDI